MLGFCDSAVAASPWRRENLGFEDGGINTVLETSRSKGCYKKA
jgi:hypothetical protein